MRQHDTDSQGGYTNYSSLFIQAFVFESVLGLTIYFIYIISSKFNTKPGSTSSPDRVAGFSIISTS
ncbi:hypothetical protein E5S67_03316 [Microcoleus sp. IPMA8]|uniref:Uncharacterized protein n=1 Tax=Microcoleus asticus IPMA8 TaxID=2563858 RepID=A0ABX2CZ35_9CYAN|nr:hypothetical protein [Microcoleus asticus IPMA8]